MTIKILFFAQLKEIFGKSSLDLEIHAGKTVGSVIEELARDHGVSALREMPLFFAINEQYAHDHTALKDGDTLACLMPMSGGAS